MGFVRNLTGKTQAKAIQKGAAGQAEAGAEASALLDPFAAIGQQGIEQAGFLTDPQAQFDFLQNNPLFQAALSEGRAATSTAQEDLFKTAAASGRLSAGDTIQETQRLGDESQNRFLLSASPLIGQQSQNIGDLIGFGERTATNQGNLLTGQAAALAAGDVGAANARSAGTQNIIDLVGGVAGSTTGSGLIDQGISAISAFSDPALKINIEHDGTQNGFNMYTWDWNEQANKLGLFGASSGVMADEIKLTNPEAITIDRGFMKVDYKAIGVH